MIPNNLKTSVLWIILAISFSNLCSGQYLMEWQVTQDEYEYGHLYFDVNQDGTKEITKELWNGISIFDGADNFNIVWTMIDENYELLTLYEVMDADLDGENEGLFISKNIYSSSSFKFQMLPILGNEPIWMSQDYPGTLSDVSILDLTGDAQLEMVFGSYQVDDINGGYLFSLYILDGATGAELWSSVNNSGYISGPYPGDMDGDGQIELLLNNYNIPNSSATLHAFGFISGSGDSNQDGAIDILDIVNIIACILDECPDGSISIDLNFDSALDVTDIVLLVNVILEGPDNLPWTVIEEWVVEQDYYEYGNLYFDISEDGYPELTKQLGNAFTVYDGVNDWNDIWTEFDNQFEYLTLYELFDLNNDDFKEALVIGSNSLSDYQVQFMMYDLQGNNPEWETQEYDGYTSWVTAADIDNDSIQEFIYGVNDYNFATGLYTSQFHIADGLNGSPEWSSPEYDGFLIGPYSGDLDADGEFEIMINLYDVSSGTYELIVWGYHPND